jgi:2-(1,2-epoxy-1,2-dihydrophenyl)acetyl-CoA isomerase
MTTAREIDAAVTYDCRDGIALVTMARPESRNALSPSLLAGIKGACLEAVEGGARALVLTGAGRSFSAGGDLSGVHDALGGDIDLEVGAMVDKLHDVIATLRSLPMPSVAAVNGAAVGAGVALALAADVRVLARTAFFVTGYVAVGASPDGGASFHLARSLGAPQALSSFVTNRRFLAADLQARGLADDVVDDDDLRATALGLARGLSTVSFPAIRAMRELVYAASGRSLQSHLDAEKKHFVAIAHTPEFRAAVAPFARRQPVVVQA